MTELKKYFDKNKDDRNVSCMLKLVHAVSSAGGKAYVVGGFVRDAILGKENKDIDFEIHGLDASTIEKLLLELSGSLAGLTVLSKRGIKTDKNAIYPLYFEIIFLYFLLCSTLVERTLS